MCTVCSVQVSDTGTVMASNVANSHVTNGFKIFLTFVHNYVQILSAVMFLVVLLWKLLFKC
jgi:hypothetical protein